MKLVVIIPALNEEATIGDVVRTIPSEIPGITEIESIVVDDASDDRTAEEALAAGARVYTMPIRCRLGKVFRAGLDQAMRRGADVVVNIDGDGQFQSGDIPKLLAPILEDKADFVTCTRFSEGRRPRMPVIKYYGNMAVRRIINYLCGKTKFSDVSCGFRAFNREVVYRLTLFGDYTYTQETFIDLVNKGLRIQELPLEVRGVREHGKSRIASNVLRYGLHSAAIMLRAVRDIQPLKFFGGIAACVGGAGMLSGLFVTIWWLMYSRTTPFTSLINISGALIAASLLLGVLALLADMLGRHRRISEELLYLARKRVFEARDAQKLDSPERFREPTLPDPIAERAGLVAEKSNGTGSLDREQDRSDREQNRPASEVPSTLVGPEKN